MKSCGVFDHAARAGDRLGVTFPSWGRSARIERVRAGVYAIHSERAGYTVRLRGVRGTRIVHPRPQNANPDPGPTLVIRVGDASTVRARISVR